MPQNLSQELRTFQLLLPTLLKSYQGLWALVQGDRLVQAYDTYAQALAEATKMFGTTTPYLIRQIVAQQPVATGLK